MSQRIYPDDDESLETDPTDPTEPHATSFEVAEVTPSPGGSETTNDFLLTDVTQIYFNEIGQNALLSAKEEAVLTRLVKQDDFDARQKMIECNLRLVVNIAKHYTHHGVALLDLIEEGNMGMKHALDKFDPERGFRFFNLCYLVDTPEH